MGSTDRRNLRKVGEVWWYRRTIPERFRDHFGRREVWRSLRTSEVGRARQRRDRWNHTLEATFMRLDEAPAPRSSPIQPVARVEVGDFFTLARNLPDECVDLVLTDPPFGGRVTEHFWDGDIDLDAMWRLLRRVAKPNAVFVFTSVQPFTTDLIVSQRKLFRWTDVWVKSRKTRVMTAAYRPLREHEDIVVFAGQGYTYNPQRHRRRGAVSAAASPTPPVPSALYGNAMPRGVSEDAFAHPSSLIYCPSVPAYERLHPTQKPVALLRELVRTFTNPGDLVLDPFGGSGSVAVAASELGRRSITFEREAAFVEAAQRRLDVREPDIGSRDTAENDYGRGDAAAVEASYNLWIDGPSGSVSP